MRPEKTSLNPPKPLGGFTLIELLTVIAVILILIAIALPNFLSAQHRAKGVQSRSYLRVIGQALLTYKLDYNVFPPADGCAGREPSPDRTCAGEGPAALGSWDGVPWVLADLGYVKDREHFYCPLMVGLFPERKENVRFAYNYSDMSGGGASGGANNIEKDSGHLWLARCVWLPAWATFDPDSGLIYPMGDDLETGEEDVMENVVRINGVVETVNGLREFSQSVNGG
jgi:prepilin-type N-terminal cleavage/methylation domain-containing protein